MPGGCLFHPEPDDILDPCPVVRAQINMAHVGEKKNAYRILLRNVEGKKPLGRLNCRWEDDIKLSNHNTTRRHQSIVNLR